MIKRFDKSLYEANDKVAKECIFSLLEESGYEVKESVKKTDVDLQVFKDGSHVANVEVEIKRVWKGKRFPYTTVQFPERKAKYTKLPIPTVFVMFNEDQSEYLIVTDKDLISSPKAMVRNKYVAYGENFFQVPLAQAKFGGLVNVIDGLVENGR